MDFCQTRHKCVSDHKELNPLIWLNEDLEAQSNNRSEVASSYQINQETAVKAPRYFISFQQNWLGDDLAWNQTWLLKNAEIFSVKIFPALLKTPVILQLDCSSWSWYNLNIILNWEYFVPIRNKCETFNIKLNKNLLRFNPDDKKNGNILFWMM